MASNPVTETEAATFNPDILHKLTIKYRMPKMVAPNICDTRYKSVTVGDNIDVSSVTRITVQSVTLGIGFKTTQYQNPTETKTTIAINKWVTGPIAIEVYEQAVADRDLDPLYRQSALDTVLVKIDSDAIAEIDNFTTNVVGTDNVSLSDDNIITMVNNLDTANVPDDNRHGVFYPTQSADFLKLDKWVNNMTRGATPINDYNFGNIYGLKLWKTTQVKAGAAGHKNGILHGEAIALVVRKEPSAWVMDDPDTLAHKIVYQAVYGTKMMRNDHGNEADGL